MCRCACVPVCLSDFQSISLEFSNKTIDIIKLNIPLLTARDHLTVTNVLIAKIRRLEAYPLQPKYDVSITEACEELATWSTG